MMTKFPVCVMACALIDLILIHTFLFDVRAETSNAPMSQDPMEANLMAVTKVSKDPLGSGLKHLPLPVYWHIPKSGGTTMKDLADCLDLVQASQAGKTSGQPPSLEVLQTVNRNGGRYINIDVSSVQGIQQAHQLGFAHAHESVDVVLTPLVHETAEFLVDHEHPGVLFALFRHPVERAVSLFYYLQHADWEVTYRPELRNTTIEDFFRTDKHVERNWMVHLLVGKPTGALTKEDIRKAKLIVRDRMVLGMTHRMSESVPRFGKFFGWDRRPKWKACEERFTKEGSNSYSHPHVQPGSEAWKAIARVNVFDLELYHYAMALFENQTDFFQSRTSG